MTINQKITGSGLPPECCRCFCACSAREILLRLFGRKAHLLDDRVGAGFDAAAHVPGLEPRKDHLARDHSGHRVGQEPAGAVAGRDPHLALVGCDEKEDAVVLLCAADLPIAAEPVGIVVDLKPSRLLTVATTNWRPVCASSACDLLVRSSDLLRRSARCAWSTTRPVSCGNVCAATGVASANQRQPQDGEELLHAQLALKLTVGAVCAAAAASNGTFGLAP